MQLLSPRPVLGIDALSNNEVFKAKIVKSYWARTQKGTSNYHVQLSGTCREGQAVNLFHKLYNSDKAVHHANLWLKPFGVSDVNELKDGDLVGHHITGMVSYRGVFHVIVVLSIDQRPPIQHRWHEKYADRVTAWHYAVQPPEDDYIVEIDQVQPLYPRSNRVRVGSRLVCRIADGVYEGNIVRIDCYDHEFIQGQEYPTTPMDTLLDVLKFTDPKDVAKCHLVGTKLRVHVRWPLNSLNEGVSLDSTFIDHIPDEEAVKASDIDQGEKRDRSPFMLASSQ